MSLVSMTWPEYLAGCCRIDGRLTRLTFRETDVLCALLMSNPEAPVKLRELVERVWPNPDREPPSDPENDLVVMMCHLRKHGVRIDARRTFGYRIPREARGRPERVRLAA